MKTGSSLKYRSRCSLKNVLTGRAVTGTGTGSFIIRIGSFSCAMIAAGLPFTVRPAFDIFSLPPT